MADIVEKTIHDPHNRVVVFSKTYCPHCRKAKQILQGILGSNGIHIVELDTIPNGEEIQQYLGQITGAKTVPRVFIDGEFFGGASDVEEKASNGQLQMQLQMKGLLSQEEVASGASHGSSQGAQVPAGSALGGQSQPQYVQTRPGPLIGGQVGQVKPQGVEAVGNAKSMKEV